MGYWDGTGKHQTDYNRLYDKLVPPSGPSKFLEGEMIRAATRINHDYHNNGLGNNWSGAYNFLDTFLGLKRDERDALEYYKFGNVPLPRAKNRYEDTDPIVIALESVMNRVIEHTLAREPHELTRFEGDMFSLSEPTPPWNEEEQEDEDEEADA